MRSDVAIRWLLLVLIVIGLVFVVDDLIQRTSRPVVASVEPAPTAKKTVAAVVDHGRSEGQPAALTARGPNLSAKALAKKPDAELTALRAQVEQRVEKMQHDAEAAIHQRDFAQAQTLLDQAGLLLAEHKDTHRLRKLLAEYQGQELRAWATGQGPVRGVALSPDARLAASCGEDKSVKLWEVATGREVRVLTGHQAWVRAVAFSPDGKRLLSGSDDRTVRLWEVATGREMLQVNHGWLVTSVAFSPGGDFLLTGAEDKSLKLWDARSGQLAQTFPQNRGVTMAVFSPDGRWIVGGDDHGALKLWQVSSGKLVRELAGHADGSVNGIVFSPDGRWIASAGDDGLVKVWDVASGQQLRSWPAHDGWVTGLAVAGNEPMLVTTGAGRLVKVWELQSGRELNRFEQPAPVICVAASTDGRLVVSGSEDQQLTVWQLPEPAMVTELVLP